MRFFTTSTTVKLFATTVAFISSVIAAPTPINTIYPLKAVAVLSNDSHNVTGTVTFTQTYHGGPTNIVANITGLEAGTQHGLHVHQFGDLSGGCDTLGPHYNPFNQTHGGPTSQVRHVGDFGNVQAADGGETSFSLTLASLPLAAGPTSIVGRGIVLHSGEDDLGLGDSPLSKTTGNSGTRLACGIIGIAAL